MLSSSITSSSNCCSIWLFCLFLCWSATHTHASDALLVPEQLSFSPNLKAQQLVMSWLKGTTATFDILILRTELNETVFYETISVPLNPISGMHQWTWTSAEPLQCTSLSIKVRSRDEHRTSEWSSILIVQGQDIPSNANSQVYPQDEVIPVGGTITFCCIVMEGKDFGYFNAGLENTLVNTTRLSRRTYSAVVLNQQPSPMTGINIFCYSSKKEILHGSVMFAGYPPLSSDFACETRDLTSAVCSWKVERVTHLSGKRETNYTINNRSCPLKKQTQTQKKCSFDRWEDNWTLVAENDLGKHNLTDFAQLSHRVHPVAPITVSAVVHPWNATILWEWEYSSYSSFALVCEVEVNPNRIKTKRTFSGVGLRLAVLSDMHPNEEYTVQIRCGAQNNFWKWGDWSKLFSFKTSTTVPDAPDVWVWMNRDNTGQVVWKALTQSQSHGRLTGYKVTFRSSGENLQHTMNCSPDTSSASFNLSHMATLSTDKIEATVIAENEDGVSSPSRVLIPRRWTEKEPISVSRAVYMDGGFPLSWESDHNATCDYVVEWYDASCRKDCNLHWIKVASPNNFSSIQSADFVPGVRYNFSLYCCSSEPPQLLQRLQGYMQELVPSRPVRLLAHQQDTNILLTWEEIPLANRRGFLLGYNVYVSNDSHLTLIANLSDIECRSYEVKGYSKGSYKFTVKPYTSAGEGTGDTASIMLVSQADWLILEISISLAITFLFLVFMTFICYKKRKWVKTALYPDIPEPKLSGNWSRTQGPLDVKPSPHSMVHIVEKPHWDLSKEMLVVIPEEDEEEERQRLGDEPADTDEPTSLRYYNQVVDERPLRPRFPDSSASSASSMDSARTDVTYTGIQTSGSLSAWSPSPHGSSDVSQSQADLALSSQIRGGGGYQPQMQSRAPTEEPFEPQAVSSGGYKPQSSWHFESPTEPGPSGGFTPSLGSPTSIASTQFLLPDGEEHTERHQQSSSAASWFTNLLSTTKP